MASSNHHERVLMYNIEKDGEDFYIYWHAESSTLGITNFFDHLYEVQLDNLERRKLLNNLAETLLAGRWKNVFNQKQLRIAKMDKESAELKYTTKSIELPKIEGIQKVKAMQKMTLGVFEELSSCARQNELLTKQLASVQVVSAPPVKKPKVNIPKPIGRREPGAKPGQPLKYAGMGGNDGGIRTGNGSAADEDVILEKTNEDVTNISPMKA